MNNSSFQAPAETPNEKLLEREAWLVRMIEAITALLESREWSILTEVFDGYLERIEKELVSESKQFPLVPEKLYVLQGQLSQEKRHNLPTLLQTWRNELTNVRKRLSPATGGDGSLEGLNV